MTEKLDSYRMLMFVGMVLFALMSFMGSRLFNTLMEVKAEVDVIDVRLGVIDEKIDNLENR